jgi:hypothetical protein
VDQTADCHVVDDIDRFEVILESILKLNWEAINKPGTCHLMSMMKSVIMRCLNYSDCDGCENAYEMIM